MGSEQSQKQSSARTKLEYLFEYLEGLEKQKIQKVLDITYWTTRIRENKDSVLRRNLEAEQNSFTEIQRETETKIRLIKRIIEEEKALMDKAEVEKILKNIKHKTAKEMVQELIEWFIMATIPFEVDLAYWESKLIETRQEEVKNAILGKVAELQQSIKNNNGGKKNAEIYLRTL